MSVPENEKINVPSTTEDVEQIAVTPKEDVVFINRDELSQHFMFTRNRPVKKPPVIEEVVEEKPEVDTPQEAHEEQAEQLEVASTEIDEVEPETITTQEIANDDVAELSESHASEDVEQEVESVEDASQDIEEEIQGITPIEDAVEVESTTEEDVPVEEIVENVESSDAAVENEVDDESEEEESIEENEDEETEEVDETEVVVDKEALQQAVNSNREKFENKKKTQQLIGKIVSGCLWTVGIFLLLLCCSNLYQQMFNAANYTGFFGIGNAIVVSNSMEPNINVNDLVFYHNTNIENITNGDVVVYKSKRPNEEERLIVHRVIDIADGYVTTQGDNNATPDAAIEYENIVGKYMFKIGGIGAFFSLMSTKWAPLIAVAIIWIIIVARIAVYFVHKKKIIEAITTDEGNREALDHFFNF